MLFFSFSCSSPNWIRRTHAWTGENSYYKYSWEMIYCRNTNLNLSVQLLTLARNHTPPQFSTIPPFYDGLTRISTPFCISIFRLFIQQSMVNLLWLFYANILSLNCTMWTESLCFIIFQLRDWNEELQSARELPKETMQQRLLRDRAIFKVLYLSVYKSTFYDRKISPRKSPQTYTQVIYKDLA